MTAHIFYFSERLEVGGIGVDFESLDATTLNEMLRVFYAWRSVVKIYLVILGSEMKLRGKSVRSWCDGSSDRYFIVDPLSYFSFQPVLHDWFNKGRGMCYPVCGMVHIKEHLLLIGRSSLCGGSGFPLSISEWSFTICLTPYNRK